MSYTINEPGDCLDSPVADAYLAPDHERNGRCEGEIGLTVSGSGSGETRAYRCAAHAEAYFERMDKLDADVQSRYPGWNIPGSMPPPGFDPSIAGERWDDD